MNTKASSENIVSILDSNAELRAAAEESKLLLYHLSKKGLTLDEGLVKSLLERIEQFKNERTDHEIEASFWRDYAELAKRAHPSTVSAVCSFERDFLDPKSLNGSTAEHLTTLKRIRNMALGVFTITLLLLAYISTAELTVSNNENLGREYLILSNGGYVGTGVEQIAEQLRANPNVTNSERQAEGGMSLEGSEGGARVDGVEAREAVTREQANAQKIVQLLEARQGEIEILVSSNDRLLKFLQAYQCMENPKIKDENHEPPQKEVNPVQSVPFDIPTQSCQKNINRVLSGFVLPAIAAWLGVSVFLMRTGTFNIENLSFNQIHQGAYWHRLVLGIIGGIAISWFTITDTSGILQSLTPAALAFLVGYSVEVLYNIMDSLVKALGGKSDN